MMEGSDEAAFAFLQAWRKAVLKAAERIQYDSQEELAEQLRNTESEFNPENPKEHRTPKPEPSPLNEEQRDRAGNMYQDLPEKA